MVLYMCLHHSWREQLSNIAINLFVQNWTLSWIIINPSVIFLLKYHLGKERTFKWNVWFGFSRRWHASSDAKIASKVIAERIKKQLPEIIHNSQSAYVVGRYISENICSILEIMDYTKVNDLPGLFMFLDFEKAFDSFPFSINGWNYLILGQVV